MKRRTWVVKYDPRHWRGYEPGRRGEDMWPMPGHTEPVVWDDPPARGDRLIWQTVRPGDRKRLVGLGRVAASRLEWLERGEYGSPGEDGEYTVHEAGGWFRTYVRLWLHEAKAPAIPSRDRERLAYPYRWTPGLSSQCSLVPIPEGMGDRLARLVERAALRSV